jgi:hypothetical protein
MYDVPGNFFYQSSVLSGNPKTEKISGPSGEPICFFILYPLCCSRLCL